MYNIDLQLVAYEVKSEAVTGFKVYRSKEQVATIEKRGGSWIGALFLGLKIMTFESENFEFVLNKITKLVN